MPEKIQIRKPRLDAAMAPDTANAESRTVEMQFYSGAEVRRYSWLRGEYMLKFSMDPAHVRLGQLNSGRAPFLESHSDWSTSDVLGVIEKGWLQDGKGKARVRFAKDDPAADQVWNKVQQGILRNVSMGVTIHKLKETSGTEDEVKQYLAVDWEPLEISVVPIGADPEAQMLSASSRNDTEGIEVEVLRDEFPNRAMSLKQEKQMETPIEQAGTTAREVPPPETPAAVADEQLNAARSVGITAEQGRITGILDVAKVCGLELAFAQKHIKANTTLDQFRALAIDEQAKRASTMEVRHVHSDILRDEADTRRRNMTGALLERFEPGKWAWDENLHSFTFHKTGGQRFHDGSRNYAACTLLDIAKECLANQNIRWQAKSRTEIAQLAFQSTSDFPNILADVAGKSLRAGYEMVPSEWRMIAARRTAADFKTQKELVLDSNARLELVPQSGEFHHGKLVEGKESWQISTYGKIIGITRQAIINDDLGAFTRTPMLLGQEVAMLEGDTVWGVVTTNGALADLVTLFSAVGHGNVAGSAAAISVESIGAARVLMMLQKSPGGKSLGIQPRYLVAPATKAQLAEQYTSANYVAAQSSDINPMAGRLTPIIESRLDTASTTAWYLFADPNTPNGTVLIYAYLEGQEGPYTETRNGFDVDGVEIKIRHDFAAAAVDYRGAVQNTGA